MKKPLIIAATLLIVVVASWSPQSAAASSIIHWRGHKWIARTVSGAPGVSHRWSAKNVRIDKSGRLHLKITRDSHGRFNQAELDSIRNGWGYGTYRWRVSTPATKLSPEHVLGLFTYSKDPAYGHREIDIEAAGWGRKPITWDYTTWADGHDPVARTKAPAAATIQQLVWASKRLTWTTRNAATGKVVARATATGADVPVPKDESLGINLWVCGCEKGWKKTPAVEVVISSFSFKPRAR